MDDAYRNPNLPHEQISVAEVDQSLNSKPEEATFPAYHVPSLQAWNQTITIKQERSVSGAGKEDPNKVQGRTADTMQNFAVISSRFNIPGCMVDSLYPLPGNQAPCKTLPHIVFNDPHFPWERPASYEGEDEHNNNSIPWVALVAFTAEELQLSESDQAEIFKNLKKDGVKMNKNFGFDLKARSLKDLSETTVTKCITDPTDREQNEKTSVVFLQKPIFENLFIRENQGSVSQFEYLSHTSRVATSETASATEGTTSAYSTVVSPRIGPLDIKQPRDVTVHLLSLETIEGRPAGSIKDRVALISLHSWTYTALPPESPDSRTSLQEIGRSIKVLRTIDTPQDSDGQTCDSIDNIMAKRQRDGYYLIRYKTITGEETAGMFRGPLVPRVIPKVFSTDGCIQSNSGTHLQILDPRTSLMDLSYSSAWQLGRTLAMDDPAFVTAPSRLRARIHAKASGTSKQGKPLGSRTTQTIVPSGVGDLISEFENLNHNLDASTASTVSSNRWKSETPPRVDSLNGGKDSYDTLEKNTDYAIVQEWVFNRLRLQGFPAQYLIPDPSFLPAETLRFFYIDKNWTESLTDGALSLGNQSASEPKRTSPGVRSKK